MYSLNSNLEKIVPLGTYVKSHVRGVLEGMAGDMSESMIAPIHPDVNIYYNSVNVIVGKQSLGKTVIAIEEIIKISVLGTHHMLVYVTKTGDENDKSFKALKNSILMPIVTISEKQVQEFIEMLIAFKNLYYEIKEDHLEDKIIDEQKEQMFNFLCINDFSRKYLHTLVLFDDISNNKLFSDESGYFPQMIKKCRHTNISYFLLIQGWKGLKPFVKNELTNCALGLFLPMKLRLLSSSNFLLSSSNFLLSSSNFLLSSSIWFIFSTSGSMSSVRIIGSGGLRWRMAASAAGGTISGVT